MTNPAAQTRPALSVNLADVDLADINLAKDKFGICRLPVDFFYSEATFSIAT
jgi:hypothetical protein